MKDVDASTASTASFRSLGLRGNYRSDRSDVVRDLYVPLLSTAAEYNRAVGYFTSTSLALVSRGLSSFVDAGHRIRLIASPQLELDDITDIEKGYSVREIVSRAATRELASIDDAGVLDGLGYLGRLIARDQLDIKLAFVNRGARPGIYHEKIAYLRDRMGDVVAFTGSSNETAGGMVANFETVEVYRSWLPGDGERAIRIVEDFDSLWANATRGLEVLTFPDVAKDQLIALSARPGAHGIDGRDDALVVDSKGADDTAAVLHRPAWLTPRAYQRTAVTAWLAGRGRGILKMATGTGKTKTALLAASAVAAVLRRDDQPLVTLIVAPYQNLVDQWLAEVSDFGVAAIGIYQSSERWVRQVETALAAARLGKRASVVLVATNDSFALDKFQQILSRLDLTLLIIADEAHHMGSARMRALLPEAATYRLALSATPERWFDDEGTSALKGYFGPVIYELGLGEAIEMGALCRYRYLPRVVELDDDETNLYAELSRKIGALMRTGESVDDTTSPLGYLLRERAGVLGHAVGKRSLLEVDLGRRRDEWFQLVYCAEGRSPLLREVPDARSQIDDVVALVGRSLQLRVGKYVAETSLRERRTLLRRFERGDDLQVLAAMRCLDEGVDIPGARVAYLLASSSNPRQFIQRRGRILRPAPGKEHAEIHDYIVVPKPHDSLSQEAERALMSRELARAAEFGKLADNYGEALTALRPLKRRFQLLDL